MKGEIRVSFEIFPPSGLTSEEALWRTVARLETLNPRFVSVTYGAGGSTRQRSTKILNHLVATTSLDIAGHISCVGANRTKVLNLAKDWFDKGVKRIVAIRGDSPTERLKFQPHNGGFASSVELVAGLSKVAEFEVFVGAYPETHPDAVSSLADLDNLKRKFDAGASSAITQYFFGVKIFYFAENYHQQYLARPASRA